YWISGDGDAIYTLSPGHAAPQLYWPLPDENRSAPSAGRFSPVEPPQPKEVLPLRGLAVTEEHYLAAGTLAPAGLVIFDLHAGGPPLWVAWPEEIEFSPYDMAAGPGGSLYILDREHRRYWILDRTFRAVPVDQERVEIEPSHGFHFHPESGPERRPRLARAFPRGISLEHAAGVEAERPVAIEALPDGTALILDAADGGARVLRYAGGRRAGVAPL